MAATKTYSTLLANQATPTQGTTKASPALTSSTADLRTYYGAAVTITITNGSSAPGAALTVQTQISGDNTNWRDYGAPVAGDIVASSAYSWTIELPRATMYARTIAYGNTTNAVNTSTEIEILTGL